MSKIHSSKITGIDSGNQLTFSIMEDNKEEEEKFQLMDIAFKKLHHAKSLCKSQKDKVKKLDVNVMNEVLKECPDVIIRNPATNSMSK